MPARCNPCNRDFVNNTALVQHQSSKHTGSGSGRRRKRVASRKKPVQKHSSHRPKTIRCPGSNCTRSFISVSALTQHLESGACRSNVDRAFVNRIVIRSDGNNVITNPVRLIRGPDGYEAPESTCTYASANSWNGMFHGCFLCNREFRLFESLDQHMQSPVHEQNIYRCPNRDSCPREFTTLSGLCQHIEQGSCGVRRSKYARLAIQSLIVGFQRLRI